MESESDFKFWTAMLLPRSSIEFRTSSPESDEITHLHLTQAALGLDALPGRHVVLAGKGVIGTLELGRCEQFSVDLHFTDKIRFTVIGDSSVHLSGYTTSSLVSPAMGDTSEDEEAPAGVPVRHSLVSLHAAYVWGGSVCVLCV
jgi:hypothetical protein